MPDIAKSDISPNLDRDKMFNELWWLNYCFCEGVGIGAVGNPFFGGEAVNICLQSRCHLASLVLSLLRVISPSWPGGMLR